MRATLDRRRVVQILCALGVAALPSARVNASSRPLLFDGVDVDGLRELGKEYRALAPADDASLAEMRALLLDAPSSDEEVISRLRSKVKADFHRGHVVKLSGWLVSRTEGRLFAVSAELMNG
jgi:hypothetical protein